MSRASASTQDFEQLKLSGNQLYKECGPIDRGRFAPVSQGFTEINSAKAQDLLKQASELAEYLAAHPSTFEKPGTNRGFADPGQVFITLNGTLQNGTAQFEIKSSLDGISNAKYPAESKVKKLVEKLRGAAGGALCGNQQFYGIAFSG